MLIYTYTPYGYNLFLGVLFYEQLQRCYQYSDAVKED